MECNPPAPDVGHCFKKEPEGFFTRILRSLVTHRSALKKKLALLDKKDKEYKMLDIRQKNDQDPDKCILWLYRMVAGKMVSQRVRGGYVRLGPVFH